jgi:hypothetical protein
VETNKSVNLLNVTCDCLLEGMDGDTNQSMQPVTAFLREKPIYQSSGRGGRQGDTHQSMSPVAAFFRVWGRRHQSINVNGECLLDVVEGETNQSMSHITAFLRKRHQSINVTYNCLLEEETPINQCHPVTIFLKQFKQISQSVS